MAIVNKCPYCYRPLGVWKHDPLLLADGSKYKWSDDTHLVLVPDVKNRIYKGMYQITETELIELQEHRKALEEELLPEAERTTFSPINKTGKFQITVKHIKELRDSTEKLLTTMGMTKDDYFNYDEEANKIIHPNGDKSEWFEPSLSPNTFQCKNLHIEDLRHNIPTMWMETWEKGTEFTNFVHAYDATSAEDTAESKDISFTANHYWETYIHAHATGMAPVGGAGATGEATTTFNLTSVKDIQGILNSKAHAWGAGCTGSGRSSINLFTYVSNPVIKYKETLRFQLKGIYTKTWIHSEYFESPPPYPPQPPDTYLIITINEGQLNYLVGKSAMSGEIEISTTEFQNFDKNLYDDYKTTHGGIPPPIDYPIWKIDIHVDNWLIYGTDGAEGEVTGDSIVEFRIDDMKLLYKTV